MNKMRNFCLSMLLIGGAGPAAVAPASGAPLLADFLKPSLTRNQAAAGETDRVIQIQSGDAVFRIGQLEEEIRTLNGRIEELGFQLLQMQEQMRQMQEDNEFRFQELEKAQGGGGGKQTRTTEPAVTEPQSQQAENGLPGVEGSTTSSTTPGAGGIGTPPANLGTLTFDNNGELQTPADNGASNGTETASLNSPEDLYQAGYNHILAGDYKLAEQVFRDYVDIYPDGPQAADAMFWLGEAQYSQNRFNDAAKTFLEAHQRHPRADKGADTMLKLGMSLAALNKRDPACKTYREVLISYPGASAAVKKKVSQEQVRASC